MRSELPKLIALARRLLDIGELGTVATLFAATGSSYRSLGSIMVGGPPGVSAGGVSGGCLEEYVVRRGRELTLHSTAVLLCFDTGSADDLDEARPVLGCGGSIQVLVERLTPGHLVHLQRLADAYDSDVASLATCNVTPAPDHPTGVRVARHWGRVGMDAATADLARDALCDRRSYSGSTGDTRQALVHYIPPLTRLVVFGAGDDVRPVSDLGQSLGWHVTVVDRRARHARRARFPSADAVIAAPWEAAVGQIHFTSNTAVVLMTHSLPDDAILLPLLANKPFAYAGVLGPGHRRGGLIELASEDGVFSEDFLSRLHGPVGLDLGDRSPAGIAVSVVAEIVAHLNDRPATPMSVPSRAGLRFIPSRADA